MTYRGVVRGTTIELEQPLPFPEGQPVCVEVRPEAPEAGHAAALLAAIRKPSGLQPGDVEAMERAIEEGKLPVSDGAIFDAP